MESECRGCIVYRNNYGEKVPGCGIGVLPYISDTFQCPCRTCIVKVVCDGSCAEYKKYVTRSNKYRRENNI